MDPPIIECSDFNRVIGIVFNNWTGLKLALEHGNGGPPAESRKKVEHLIELVRHLLENNSDYYAVADELETVLDEQFCTIVEDGSSDEVANELCHMFGLWMAQNFGEISSRISSFRITGSILEPTIRVSSKVVPFVAPESGMPRTNEEDSPMEETSEWTVVGKKKR